MIRRLSVVVVLCWLAAAAPLGSQVTGSPAPAEAEPTAAAAAAAAAQPGPGDVAGAAAAERPAFAERAGQARTMRAYWHVFIAFAVTLLLLFGYAVSLGRRWARLEREILARQ